MAKYSQEILRSIHQELQSTYKSICNFKPHSIDLHVIDDSGEQSEDTPQTILPGLAKFKESVKRDIEALDKVLESQTEVRDGQESQISINAPYLLAVWKEVLSGRPPIVSMAQHFPCHLPIVQTSSSPACVGKLRKGYDDLEEKVDVVTDGGRHWIRVNTTTATRLAYELQELDAYTSDSESSDDADETENLGPRPQVSLIRMAKSLVSASRANRLPLLTGEPRQFPKVTIRLTRLPDYTTLSSPIPSRDDDPILARKIFRVLDEIRLIGVELEFGERDVDYHALHQNPSRIIHDPAHYRPTTCVNLDLSLLVALVSDLTHSKLPSTAEEAISRFPPKSPQTPCGDQPHPGTIDGPKRHQGSLPQTRALALQLQQEIREGLLDILRRRLSPYLNATSSAELPGTVEFWTTSEARDRFFDIVFTIGGERERNRARALFGEWPGLHSAEAPTPLEEREQMYWQDSRYSKCYLPLIPIKVFDATNISSSSSSPGPSHLPLAASALLLAISNTCRALLSLHKDSPPSHFNPKSKSAKNKITPHTLRTLLSGASRGWTTLTANRASVKALMSEVRARYGPSLLLYGQDGEEGQTRPATVWVVGPRSLAEGAYRDGE